MMKKILLSLFVIATAFSAKAQTIEVLESSKKFDKTSRPAIMVTIPMADDKMVEKEWKRFIKDYNPEDFKSKKEMLADNATIPRISENTIDVYATTETNKESVTLYVSVDLGGAFLNATHGDKFIAMKGLIRDFAISIVEEIYNEKIKEQEKAVEDVSKDVEKATDDKEHLAKEIEIYEEKIENNKLEIEKLTQTIEEQGKVLSEEQKKLEEIKKEASKIK